MFFAQETLRRAQTDRRVHWPGAVMERRSGGVPFTPFVEVSASSLVIYVLGRLCTSFSHQRRVVLT